LNQTAWAHQDLHHVAAEVAVDAAALEEAAVVAVALEEAAAEDAVAAVEVSVVETAGVEVAVAEALEDAGAAEVPPEVEVVHEEEDVVAVGVVWADPRPS